MSYDYAPDRADLAAEVQEYGAAMVLRRGTTDHQIYGLRRQVTAREADGTTVKITDQAVLVPAEDLSIVPTTTDKLVDGVAWIIVKVDPIKPGPLALAYTLYVRK
ncbi:MAG: hypothetical protein KQJ78_07690 [Deltaproteobacteria bacterium]|nr:hypothetical protein [Deltaproteobacteria bacterium]